jgi:hypothetical protein
VVVLQEPIREIGRERFGIKVASQQGAQDLAVPIR